MMLKEFYDAMVDHDWLHQFSDDPYVSRKGRAEQVRLAMIARESEEHRKLYDQFTDHYTRYVGERPPLPRRPLV